MFLNRRLFTSVCSNINKRFTSPSINFVRSMSLPPPFLNPAPDLPTSEEILQKLIEEYANKKESKVSLTALMETAKGRRLDYFHFSNIIDDYNLYYDFDSLPIQKKVQIQIACFLHRELPVRLAKRAVELESYEIFKSSGKFILFFCK